MKCELLLPYAFDPPDLLPSRGSVLSEEPHAATMTKKEQSANGPEAPPTTKAWEVEHATARAPADPRSRERLPILVVNRRARAHSVWHLAARPRPEARATTRRKRTRRDSPRLDRECATSSRPRSERRPATMATSDPAHP